AAGRALRRAGPRRESDCGRHGGRGQTPGRQCCPGDARVGARGKDRRHGAGARCRPAGGHSPCRPVHSVRPGSRDGRPAMNGLLRAAAVVRKDLLVEWRGRQTTTATGMVALLMILLLGFVIGSEPGRAAAILWVAMGFAAVLGIPRVTQGEVDQQALETLLLYPGSREHLFWGKCAALTAMLSARLVARLALRRGPRRGYGWVESG